MPIQTGVGATLAYKAESPDMTKTVGASGQYLRRVSSSLSVQRAAIESNEIRTDAQVADQRLAGKVVQGTIDGEANAGGYQAFWEALARGTWATYAPGSPGATTIAVSGNVITWTATSGMTQKVGDVWRITGATGGGAALNGQPITVIAITSATVFSVTVPNMTGVSAGSIGSPTLTGGKRVFTNLAAPAKRSFSIEQYFSDITLSQVFWGCRVGSARISLPPTEMATVSFGITGKDMDQTSGAAALTSPAALGTGAVMAGVNGVLAYSGTVLGTITGLEINIDNGLSTESVVGSKVTPDVFYGRHRVTGSLTALLDGSTLLSNFLDEVEVEITCTLAGGGTTQDYLAFHMPRVKLSGGQVDNRGEGAIPVSFNFNALLKPTTANYDSCTIKIIDSLAP